MLHRHSQQRSSPPSSRAPQPVASVVPAVRSQLWVNPDRHKAVEIVATMPIGQVVFQFDPDKLQAGRVNIVRAIELEKHISRRQFRIVEAEEAPELTVIRDV